MNKTRCFVSLFYISIFSSSSNQNVLRNSERTYIHKVTSCPRTGEEFLNASHRFNCSLEETRFRYHCLPDSGLTNLYEFCYDKSRPLIQRGFCVVLDINSLQLDDYNCSSFTDGCPSTYYDSDKLYDYPRCLDIDFQIHCFRGEENCAEQRFQILTTGTPLSEIGTIIPLQENVGQLKYDYGKDIIIGVICSVIGLFILIIVIIYIWKFRRNENKPPPQITTSTLNPYPITEGQTATLACSLSANLRESINWSWVKSDQPDNVLKTDYTYSIPNIQRGQSGRYMCTATNSIGTSEPVTIEIDVQYKPEVTTGTLNPCPITECQTATLACALTAANPRESINWSWVKSDQPDNVLKTDSTYSIPNIKRGQSGRYECRAANSIGTSEPVTIEIDVQYKPEVASTTLNPYPITEGRTATLACSLTAANPRENINWSWIKSDQPDNVLKTGPSYSIPNIKRGQSGRYECRATNSIGTSEPVTIEIDVQYKPEVCSTCTTQGSYKIIEGQTATFICQLIAANPNTGVTWRWFKADLPSNILHSGPTFTLPNIQREQSGTYWCTASNIIGISDPVTIHVAVQDIPAITIQGDLEVVCGETACIKAEIQQAHNWSTTWYRVTEGTLKQIDSDTNKYAKTTNRQLVIQRVSKDDQGEYQAIITGKPYGQYLKVPSEVFTLKILGERPILQKLEASLEKEGISFHYEYEVLQESPKANSITWTRNGENLIIDHNKYIGGDIKNNSLTIKFPTMQDIGEYTCTISNAVGAVSKSLIIDEDLLIGRWASNLKMANVGKWNNLVGSPPTSDLERIKEVLNNSDLPQEITEKLMENSTERNWPTGLHTRQKREENSKMFERFKTRKIKGKQAVVILFFENKHMPEDLIKKPGIVITFCGGVK